MVDAVTPGASWACCDPPVPSRATSLPWTNVRAVPLCRLVIPLSVQPPSRLLASLLGNRIGSVHSHEATKACRRSHDERPRSVCRSNGLETVAPRLLVELLSMDFASV